MPAPDPEHPDADTTSLLRQALRQADAGAFLVEPRVTRRLIRELHSFARLSSRVPHTEVCVVDAANVRRLTHPDELGLESFEQLPDPVLLIALPEEHEVRGQSVQDQMVLIWRRLFHGAIDRAMQSSLQSEQITRADIQSHIDTIGQVEFDEAHAVLASELRLIDPESRIEAFTELVATWWELHRFAPDMIPIWFPSLASRQQDDLIPDVRIDPNLLFVATRLTGAPNPDLTPQVVLDEAQLSGVRQDWIEDTTVRPSERRYQRLQRRRQRAAERGNTVAAGLSAMFAAESAPTGQQRQNALELATSDVHTLARRLKDALNFDEADYDAWYASLQELFRNATHGFWNADKKLLHDLQKVCMDHERVTYKVDLVKWIFSRGQRPLRRPLTHIREVMMAKHLASSASRLVYVRLSGQERDQLAELLHEAAHLAEEQMRHRMRPRLRQTLLEVGFRPANVPEEVAFDKLIEESLDCIAYRGYLTMGYLRDAISRNDLKLADLTDPRELYRGDHLLRTDDELDIALDGVYRRGEFYLRGLQRVSSMAFGTRAGRFITQFIVIPFGGALVIVEGATHLYELLFGPKKQDSPTIVSTESSLPPDADSATADESDAAESPSEQTSSSPAASDDNPDVEADTDPGSPTADSDTATDSADVPTAADVTMAAAENSVQLTEVVQTPADAALHREHLLQPATRLSLILAIGLVLMALVHLPTFREVLWTVTRSVWRAVQLMIWQLPKRIMQFPLIQWLWRSPFVISLRRYLINPALIASVPGYVIPTALDRTPWSPWLMLGVTCALSAAFNSRLGRDTEELVAEWIGNTWHNLHARVVMAAFDWIVDFFKWALAAIERLIYAVDEWLRFHSEESWASIIVKAVTGVVWTFVVFLIRIYVNLLIEPQVNPIKHFPVVTVAHKIILPLTPFVIEKCGGLLANFIGVVLADFVVGVTWFLFPGVFGFLVWELKENWRLYESNRVTHLQPVVVGSHGEPLPRLVRPGFHSGTLPKAFARLRRLEHRPPSFRRFSQRRAWQDVLHHAERDLARFVERDLLRLLDYCPVWQDTELELIDIRIACNSVLISVDSEQLEGGPIRILFQEQSHWIVVTVAEPGLLRHVTAAQLHSFDTALLGFYRKAGVELVREQLERSLVGSHPYDVRSDGLIIWPESSFDREVTVNLLRPHQVRPLPAPLAVTFGFSPTSVENVIFSRSRTNWYEWARLWHVNPTDTDGDRLPLACLQSARLSLLRHL